ncbi:hypothetical protein [Mesorhizobium sp. Cs1321R2N1]|uniref:hypothetical protein n=1 Tax=Mesorhizobium sp. Cs1321R2N1 TaxID=3015174 RepID=UPI00301C13D8
MVELLSKRWHRPSVAGILSASLALLLSGCMVADQYGSRATNYNGEAAYQKSSTILTNIIRAAYREPLQFTDLSTVTGSASASLTMGGSLPARIGGTAFAAPQLLTLSPTLSASGGPQFNIANLNTQEFYQGIQSPLEAQIIANYVTAGMSLKLLLRLFVSEIEVSDGRTHSRIIIHNRATTIEQFNTFTTTIDNLVRHGLSLEPIASPESIGPVLTRGEAADARLLAGFAQAVSAGGTSLKLQPVTETGSAKNSHYRLSKSGSRWRFCFKPMSPKSAEVPGVSRLSDATELSVPLEYAHGQPFISVHVGARFVCGANSSADASPSTDHAADNLKFTFRSVEGIFLFLGEIVRTQLGIGGGVPTKLADPNGGSESEFSESDPATGPTYIFKVEKGFGVRSRISANALGSNFTVASDPSGNDASSQVIQILTDLIALKSSAKSLPAPSVIPVIQ